MRVLVADKLSENVLKRLSTEGCEVVFDPSLKDDALQSKLKQFDPNILVVRSTKVQQNHFEAAKQLALVIRAGAGVNTIDVDFAAARGIYVANCPGKNAIAVAELVIGQLINLDRRIADNVATLRKGQWAKNTYGIAKGLYGRRLAVLGTGRIGYEVIVRAKALGMTLRAWDKVLTPECAAKWGIEFAATALEACTGADAVTVHLPITDETRDLVNAEILAALNPGAYVINTSRGGIVDEKALVEAIHQRGLRAALDVYANEPAATDNVFDDPIANEPALYGTHHIGASTDQATEAVGEEVYRIIGSFVSDGRVPNCVNLADKTPATHLLVVRHADEVGVLASVLNVLRESGVNVQEMENIVFSGAKAACAHVQVDSWPGGDLLKRIEGAATIFNVSLIELQSA